MGGTGMKWENPQIEEILKLEWEMFVKVQNVDGPAHCQFDQDGFYLHRGSQFAAWDEETRASYLEDLHLAEASGRNLLMEKYAYMMEYTSPEEFERIRHLLPTVDCDKRNLVDEIAAIETKWVHEAAEQYPNLLSRGRPLDSAEDVQDNTSVQSYLRGELVTYSPQTLVLYRSHIAKLQAENKNLNLMVLEQSVRAIGYPSLEQAEAAVGQQAQ
jgi:hypothetical protein